MKKRFYHYKGYVIKKMLIGIMIIASHHYLKPNELKEVLKKDTVLIIIQNKMIIGSIRAHISNRTCYIGRVIVHPLHQNKGVGSILINEIEKIFNSLIDLNYSQALRMKKTIFL